VHTATLALDEAVATAATGDIWLFRGRTMADRAIRTLTNSPGQDAWVRLLDGPITRAHEDRIMETIDRLDGRPFPSALRVARGWVLGRLRRHDTSFETVFCAELVATTYQAMGLLPASRPARAYDPGTFWSGDAIELVEPYSLGGEIAVTP
jgi:hypothetical protein